MPKSPNQKSKILYLLEILYRESDENHVISTKELIARLNANGIKCDRKTIYSDMEELSNFGFDIIGRDAASGGGFYMASREFEVAELKLLVDAVSASKFITEKKSRELIKKLSSLASKNEAGTLQREVFVSDRAKAMNESIYYSVDAIHNAIRNNKQLSFVYYIWTPEKELIPKHEGKRTLVSPWMMVWADDNYYLVAFDNDAGEMRHYRVDKIRECKVLSQERIGKDVFDKLDMGRYSTKNFGMYHGDEEDVTLELPTALAGVIIDRFGTDTPIKYLGNDKFTARVSVCVSQQFYGWVLGLGSEVRIIKPESIKKDYTDFLKHALEAYTFS